MHASCSPFPTALPVSAACMHAWIYGFNEFDCKVLFPNIDDLKMDGDTVFLPAHIWMAESDADIQDSTSVGEQQE
jgi:hypothetical protein